MAFALFLACCAAGLAWIIWVLRGELAEFWTALKGSEEDMQRWAETKAKVLLKKAIRFMKRKAHWSAAAARWEERLRPPYLAEWDPCAGTLQEGLAGWAEKKGELRAAVWCAARNALRQLALLPASFAKAPAAGVWMACCGWIHAGSLSRASRRAGGSARGLAQANSAWVAFMEPAFGLLVAPVFDLLISAEASLEKLIGKRSGVALGDKKEAWWKAWALFPARAAVAAWFAVCAAAALMFMAWAPLVCALNPLLRIPFVFLRALRELRAARLAASSQGWKERFSGFGSGEFEDSKQARCALWLDCARPFGRICERAPEWDEWLDLREKLWTGTALEELAQWAQDNSGWEIAALKVLWLRPGLNWTAPMNAREQEWFDRLSACGKRAAAAKWDWRFRSFWRPQMRIWGEAFAALSEKVLERAQTQAGDSELLAAAALWSYGECRPAMAFLSRAAQASALGPEETAAWARRVAQACEGAAEFKKRYGFAALAQEADLEFPQRPGPKERLAIEMLAASKEDNENGECALMKSLRGSARAWSERAVLGEGFARDGTRASASRARSI